MMVAKLNHASPMIGKPNLNEFIDKPHNKFIDKPHDDFKTKAQ